MKPKPIITIETDEHVDFNVITVNISADEPYDAKDFLIPGICKVVLIMNRIKRIFYFRNFIEMSRERIIQDERINQLNK